MSIEAPPLRRRQLPFYRRFSTRLLIQAQNAMSIYLDDAGDPVERSRRAQTLIRGLEIFLSIPDQRRK